MKKARVYFGTQGVDIVVDEETRPILDAIDRAKKDVASWPKWKRGY